MGANNAGRIGAPRFVEGGHERQFSLPRRATVRGSYQRLSPDASAGDPKSLGEIPSAVTAAPQHSLTHSSRALEKNVEMFTGRRFQRRGMRCTRRGAQARLKPRR